MTTTPMLARDPIARLTFLVCTGFVAWLGFSTTSDGSFIPMRFPDPAMGTGLAYYLVVVIVFLMAYTRMEIDKAARRSIVPRERRDPIGKAFCSLTGTPYSVLESWSARKRDPIVEIQPNHPLPIDYTTPGVKVRPGHRFAILKRDGYRCQLCRRTASEGARLEVDHTIARAKGGTNTPDNLWTLCATCNRGKSDSSL
jgi:hypothetical protein